MTDEQRAVISDLVVRFQKLVLYAQRAADGNRDALASLKKNVLPLGNGSGFIPVFVSPTFVRLLGIGAPKKLHREA